MEVDASVGALAEALLAGRTPPEGAATAAPDPEALAWVLKDACLAGWTNDPARCRAAALGVRALAARHGTPALTALSFWADGIGALADSQFADAVTNLRQAVAAWQLQSQPLHAAQASVALLMPLALLGRFDEALSTGEAAEAELTAHGDANGAARVALNLGSLAMHRDRYADATAYYRRAGIRFARLGDKVHSVMADIGLADAMGYDGRTDEAARIYDRAEMRARQHDLPVLAASAQHGRALLALGKGRYREALAGLVLAQRAFAQFEVDHYLTEAERDLADAYLELRLLPEALALYDALALRLQAQGNEATLPWLLLQRARALTLAGCDADAEATLVQAQQKFTQQDNAAGAALAELADIERRLGHSPTAEAVAACAERAAVLGAALPAEAADRARLLQAVACRLAGRPAEALALLSPLVAATGPAAAPKRQARAWDETGHAHEALGDPVAAAHAYERAIEVFEDMRAALPGDDFQIASLSDHLHPFQARLALALGALAEPPEAVLGWLDRYRARVLSERLGRGADDSRVVDEDTRQTLLPLRARLNWIRRQEQRRARDGDEALPAAMLDEARQIEHEVLEIARRARALQARQHEGAGGAVEAAALPVELDVAALRRHFCGARALVVYGTVCDELLAVVVAGGRVQLLRRLAGWSVVQGRVQRLRFQIDSLRAGAARMADHGPQLLQRATAHLQALHRDLWAPLQAALAGAADVAVVPCDVLQALPFAALHDGAGWLDERCRLHLVPSAAMALRAVEAGDTEGPRVLMGESSRLPFVRAELEAAARALGRATVLMDAQATVHATLEALPAAQLLHLACHAEFRADSPGHSALHLGDGVLTAAQIEEQRSATRLVVLSACDTGRAQATPGDEGVGLVRAFLLAGAQEVVASLWAVDDEATALLMGRFYRHWSSNGGQAGPALQRARAELRQTHPHPHHWAAFVLHGGVGGQEN
ncbi:MAG: hypothetical protein AD742_11095 [Methylibium sp. NZG]|nr:MAG: hypothetical protein AD742_11095 [Methylibium sp. NZG]